MYIGNAKVEHNMEYIFTNPDIKLSKEQFEYLTDRYNRAIRMEKNNKVLISGLTLSAAWWLFFAYKNDVPVNSTAYQKCIDEVNSVNISNKSFS
jgi:hypothetical protein